MDAGEMLNFAWQKYAGGEIGKKTLEGILVRQVLKCPRLFLAGFAAKEDCADFLAWIWPRLSRMPDHFRGGKASFSTAFVSFVRWSAREFMKREKDGRFAEEVCRETLAGEWPSCVLPEYRLPDNRLPEDRAAEDRAAGIFRDETGCRGFGEPLRALVLFLKSYRLATDGVIEAAAPLFGMDGAELLRLVDRIREMRAARDKSIREAGEKTDWLFFRCRYYERKLAAQRSGSPEWQRLAARLDRTRKRLERANGRVRTLRTGASSRQIALALGMTERSVDNLLRRERRAMKKRDAGN